MSSVEQAAVHLRPAALSIFCSLKRAEVAKASPNLKNKEVVIKMFQIWNQLGDKEQAPYFSAAAKYPRRDRAEMGEIVKTDLIEQVVEEGEAEEVTVDKERKRSGELILPYAKSIHIFEC